MNYRDFHLIEEQSSVKVQISPSSEFLAKTIFDETTYKKVGFWERLMRIIVGFVNIFVSGRISYQVATR